MCRIIKEGEIKRVSVREKYVSACISECAAVCAY